MPQRIQLRRTKGWKMPPNTVKVDRSTRWGNAWSVGSNMFDGDKFRECVTVEDAVRAFRNSVDWDPDATTRCGDLLVTGGYSDTHNNQKTIRKFLRGKNLACWCPEGSPCHADVLLEIANRD